MRISRDSDSDPCPVPDQMLGELYRASKAGLPELIATVSPDVRAALAMYCYRRGHLKGIGLAIASTCASYDLETVGGTAGAALYARSRETMPVVAAPSPYVARQKITLASGSLRKSLPIDEEVDAEADADGIGEVNGAETNQLAADDAEAPESDDSTDDSEAEEAGMTEPTPSGSA